MVKRILSKLFGGQQPPKNTTQETTEEKTDYSPKPKPTPKTQTSGEEGDLCAFVDYVVKALVMHPEDVDVTSEIDEQGLLIRICCRQDEVGRVIGKSGKTIRAIRSLVKGAAARQGQKASVIVMED